MLLLLIIRAPQFALLAFIFPGLKLTLVLSYRCCLLFWYSSLWWWLCCHCPFFRCRFSSPPPLDFFVRKGARVAGGSDELPPHLKRQRRRPQRQPGTDVHGVLERDLQRRGPIHGSHSPGHVCAGDRMFAPRCALCRRQLHSGWPLRGFATKPASTAELASPRWCVLSWGGNA